MTDIKDIYWLAGILEGEGTFSDETGSPRIQLKMTDRDIVIRAANLLDTDAPVETREGGFNTKDAYVTRIHGNKAIQWMFTLYSIFGERRRARLKEIINRWKIRERRDMGVDTCRYGHRLSVYGKDYYLAQNSNFSFTKRCRLCAKSYRRTHKRQKRAS